MPPRRRTKTSSSPSATPAPVAGGVTAAGTSTTANATTTKSTTSSVTATATATATASQSNSKDDAITAEEGCLHCHASVANDNIQVRCDECGGYICNDCHWCHEFQANHEIRVCDRCDAFYCKSCDEMDQCDDCGEVVCGSCSTLLSCKFCGGGLCEDCATACGRCGIVLCSRDAKFAVDCDTCRLSYCLVCLASGSKDPCVRCGHRPSKRMEQLVHLRLKSIYKAFKQSSGTVRASSHASSNTTSSGGTTVITATTSTSTHTAANPNVRERQNDDPDELHVAEDPEALLQVAAASAAAKLKMAASGHYNHHHSTSHHSVSATERLEQFMAEKEKADKAAADLLAELEEEEEHKKTKKSKKQRKKERQMAKKADEEPKVSTDDDNAVETLESDAAITDVAASSGRANEINPDGEAQPTLQRFESSDGLMEAEADVDPLEEELGQLIEDGDMEGIDELLTSIKGVPGRAVLRKNAKKALKRLRSEQVMHSEELEVSEHEATLPDAEEPVIVRTPTPTNDPKPQPKHRSSRLAGWSLCHNPTNNPNRVEYCMPIDSAIVGWFIGKGGQRIRELMEESGARIWVEQDVLKQGDPRNVFVSGQRKYVDVAIALVNELVENPQTKHSAPIPDTNSFNVKSSSEGSKSTPAIVEALDVTKTIGATQGLKPRRKEAGENLATVTPPAQIDPQKSEQVVTCDPRFVPLLIGRRGWTIKNIQDSSGARVDIDQTVTPRRITISGTESNVKIALRMVRDVLSYPHSQLQGSVESPAELEVVPDDQPVQAQPVQCPDKDSAMVNVPDEDDDEVIQLLPPVNQPPLVEQGTRGANSPPSSLIMTGDAKSTISASSSLSSTPEPSMASSIPKGTFSQLPSGPMLPPPVAISQLESSVAAETLPQQVANASSHAFAFPRGSLYGVPSTTVPQTETLPQGAQLHGSPVQLPRGITGVMPGQAPSHPFPLGQGTAFSGSPGVLRPLSSPHGPPMSSQPVVSFQHSHGGFPVPTQQPPLMHDRAKHDGRDEVLWKGISSQAIASPMHSAHPHHSNDGFHFGAAVDFLQNSALGVGPSRSIPGVVTDQVGLPAIGRAEKLGLDQNRAIPGVMLHAAVDDSQIIDSLFGPTAIQSSTTESAILMSGIESLSLNKDTLDSGLWGSTTLGVDPLQGMSPFGTDNQNGTHQPNSFGSQPIDDHRPSQSRFAWGSFADRQQS